MGLFSIFSGHSKHSGTQADKSSGRSPGQPHTVIVPAGKWNFNYQIKTDGKGNIEISLPVITAASPDRKPSKTGKNATTNLTQKKEDI